MSEKISVVLYTLLSCIFLFVKEDFVGDTDLYMACLILQKQIECINGNKENIIIPIEKMREIQNTNGKFSILVQMKQQNLSFSDIISVTTNSAVAPRATQPVIAYDQIDTLIEYNSFPPFIAF